MHYSLYRDFWSSSFLFPLKVLPYRFEQSFSEHYYRSTLYNREVPFSSNNTTCLFLLVIHLLVTQKGQEDIVPNLDGVDVQQTLRWWDERKVDRVCGDPNGP